MSSQSGTNDELRSGAKPGWSAGVERVRAWSVAVFCLAIVTVTVFTRWLALPTEVVTTLMAVLVASGFLAGTAELASRLSLTEAAEISKIREERTAIVAAQREKTLPDVFETIQLGLNHLAEYYVINKGQARNSFFFSVAASVVGLALISAGLIWYATQPRGKAEIAVISGVAGTLLQFISGAYFFLYRKSLEQLNFFYVQLVRTQDTMLAVRLTQEVGDNERKGRLVEALVAALMSRGTAPIPPPSDAEGKSAGHARGAAVTDGKRAAAGREARAPTDAHKAES